MENYKVNNMTIDPEELKKRLESDENMWLKITSQVNSQQATNLNQMADLFRLVQRLIVRLDKLEKKIKGEN